MSILNKDGSTKPFRQYIEETKKKRNIKLLREAEKSKEYSRHTIIISHREWARLQKSIRKLKDESPVGALQQFIINDLFREFNDKVLGVDHD